MAQLRRLAVSDLPKVQEVQREPACLYVIQEGDGGHFKIGVAGHPARRISDLQAGNRQKLKIVAAYAGPKASCLDIEKIALRFFRASPGSEWVVVDYLSEVTELLDAFCEGNG